MGLKEQKLTEEESGRFNRFGEASKKIDLIIQRDRMEHLMTVGG